jgi:DNA-binding FadR family transcriptional regulator
MTKSPRVASELRDAILSGRYRAGDRLPSERELVKRLGIHRGAIREGLRALEQLGLVHIQPGGARVCPLHEASLDIVGPLLDLEDPPDPQLVRQVLEVDAVLLATAVRLNLEQDDHETIRQARALLARVAEATDEAGYVAAEETLLNFVVEACGNLPLRLARRALKIQFWDRLEKAGLALRAPAALLLPLVRELDQALGTRNARAASRLVYSLSQVHRRHIVRELEQAHAPLGSMER